MEDWIKIYSYDSLYQAELTKGILDQNNIKNVILNAKDSLFLIGEYELYVLKGQEKRAQAVVDEYKGLTKVDSFIMRSPVERLKDILDDNGIASVVKTNKNPRYVLDNYELYVNNEDVEKVVPFLTGEKLEGWKKVCSCFRTRQARFRIELLNEVYIPGIVIKKRNADFMKQEIDIYVKEEDFEKAEDTLETLNGWIKIGTFDNIQQAEIQESQLGKAGIRGIIKEENGNILLFVEGDKEEKALTIITESQKWMLLTSFTTQLEADYAVALLENAGIEAVCINNTDLTLKVDTDVYVEEFKLDAAAQILKNISVYENE